MGGNTAHKIKRDMINPHATICKKNEIQFEEVPLVIDKHIQKYLLSNELRAYKN